MFPRSGSSDVVVVEVLNDFFVERLSMVNLYAGSEEYAHEIFRQDAVGRVGVEITVPQGQESVLSTALHSYFDSLQSASPEDAAARGYAQVFFDGGWSFCLLTAESLVQTPARLVLESAGEDAMSSLEIAAENLAEVAEEACPGAEFAYEELPVRAVES